ncbi:DUF4249 family protein [Ascidiimonas aurantiaca]|uniref:DUF4249 family protein n=1 Tax=Ascidiimonas aurantiaca TaxID=1685432 RepID=UPI0030EB5825
MKRPVTSYILYLLFCFYFTSCEDVIDVDVPFEGPRLIIDALIRIDDSSSTTIIRVKALESSSFFEEPTPAQLTQITVVNLDQASNEVLLETEPGSGIYERLVATEFLTSGELLLQIEHEGQQYLARTRYVETNPFNSVEQGDRILFDDEDTEVVVSFTDIPNADNFYLFDFDFAEFLTTEDTFYQGQDFSLSYFYDENLTPGQEVTISILGIDEPFYNYMNQLLEQTSEGFGPFDTPSATVRGNLINVTDIDNMDFFDNVDQPNNFALGYFAVCQTFSQTLIIE